MNQWGEKNGLKRLGLLILGSITVGLILSLLRLPILDEGDASSYLPYAGLFIIPFIAEWTSKGVKRQTTDTHPIQISKFSGYCFLASISIFTIFMTIACVLDRAPAN